MSTPEEATEFPTPQVVVNPPTPSDDVPDHTVTEDDAVNPWFGTLEQKPQPEPADKRVRLGENKKRGSGVRQLTKSDLKQLHGYYDSMAMIAMLVRPSAAEAITNAADECVQRWDELAKQNDKVRKMLLTMLEGGAWSALIAAHMPIMWACIPEKAFERMPLLFGAFNRDQNNSDNGSEE